MTRPESAAQTRARILTVARALFVMDGYEHVSLRKIAKAADVTIGAISHHWPSKEALFTEAAGRAPMNDTQAAIGLCALKAIANGEGYYGAQAYEYKRIAQAAVDEILPGRALR